MIWNTRKQKNNQSEQEEEKGSKKQTNKSEDSVSSLWYNFKHSNIGIIGMQEGEEKEQEIENLFEKIMKKMFPNLEEEIGM